MTNLTATYKPLEIIAELESNFICMDRIMFDSIIAYSVAKETLGENFEYSTKEENLIDFDLPIEKKYYSTKEDSGPDIINVIKYIYMASQGICDSIESIEKWKKKYPVEYLHYINSKKVRINSGTRKEYNMPMISNSTDKMTFFCIGDKHKIGELLKRVYFIGKKRSQGFGRIKKWIIHDCDIDRCNWKNRPLPSVNEFGVNKLLERFDIKLTFWNMGARPPYWAMKNQEYCFCI